MRIALIHDFLSQDGGAERVLKIFHELWPDAPTYVLFYDQHKMNPVFHDKDLRPSMLQRLPGIRTHYQWFLPFMPHAIERLDLSAYDVIVSSSSAFAKGVLTEPHQLHISYCHTPTRYLWSDTHSYVDELRRNRLVKAVVPFLLTNLRVWDKSAAERVDCFIANSETVRRRIAKYYRRDSTVIHPPVETDKFSLATSPGIYFLTGGRLVAYKRFDLVIQAFNRLGLPLKIFGVGPEDSRLRAVAKPNIEFLGYVSDEIRRELYRGAIAFIHPQIEDLGLTAIESMASGRPVIAYADGGALETVKDGSTGVFFKEQTWEALFDTILHFDPTHFSPQTIQSHAETWNTNAFKEKMSAFVQAAWEEHGRSHQ